VIIVLIAAFIATTFYTSQEPEPQSLPVAPNFTLYDIDGNMFNLTDFRGKIVLLDFMTTWCEACNRSVAHTKELAEIHGSDLVIISISVDPGYDTDERLRGYMLYHDSPWIHARDIAHVGDLYGVDGVPTFVLIDQEGRIFDTQVGVIPHEVFSREIEVML
jgi:cytochrome oxidase Cu insertion factor (SCO1/SenC/PrrC family)